MEFESIRELGFSSVLLLTGESPNKAGVDYIASCVKLARNYFPLISLEVYPVETDEYKKLVEAGASGLTIYQETYDPLTYSEVHSSGRKRDFEWRLDTPDRAALAGFRKIGLGALLGLYDWRSDAAMLGAHAAYLTKKYWRTEISVSFPRLRGSFSNFSPPYNVADLELVQMMLAVRLYSRFSGITLSTRESPDFRDHMVGLAVTSMSAGSRTNPGGYKAYAEDHGAGSQFDVHDGRSVAEVAQMIRAKGHYPVMKDWAETFGGVKDEGNH